ncbi:Uncharacterized protein Rs2_07968 [Raphanus sativus]|nr:Uncharacterized protein Rs2_07968 [Raphanus sativus]
MVAVVIAIHLTSFTTVKLALMYGGGFMLAGVSQLIKFATTRRERDEAETDVMKKNVKKATAKKEKPLLPLVYQVSSQGLVSCPLARHFTTINSHQKYNVIKKLVKSFRYEYITN